jgi:hypothetical protein
VRYRWWRTVHRIIIVNFLLEIMYGFYMVFFAVGGVDYPLFRKATETPIEIILKRRLYGIETWLAIVGLSLYLAVTEISPWRRWRRPRPEQLEDVAEAEEAEDVDEDDVTGG